MTDLSLFGAGAQVPVWAGKLIAFLSAAYPAWKPRPESIAVYYSVLHDIEPQDVESGVREYVSGDHEFAPSAGQVRAAAIAARKRRLPHGRNCDCMDCVARLPIEDRWHRLSPAMREHIERENPAGARKLREAADRALSNGVDQVRRTSPEAEMKSFQRLTLLVVVAGLLVGTCASRLARSARDCTLCLRPSHVAARTITKPQGVEATAFYAALLPLRGEK